MGGSQSKAASSIRASYSFILCFKKKYYKEKNFITMEETPPLHLCHVQKSSTIINRLHMLLHFIALIPLFYYRVSYFLQDTKHRNTPIFPWLLVFASELLLSFLWILSQACRWRTVSRTVFPDRLPEDDKLLPAIDVLICTADPDREPILEVMNTVLSAMALDYPPEKIHVYLSDDSGSSATLHAMKETLGFARVWLSFCRAYGLGTRCPEAYFSALDDDDDLRTELVVEKQKIKGQYEMFKERVERAKENVGMENRGSHTSQDHPPVIEVIEDAAAAGADNSKMPLLVYVVLSSTRKAMCFHLDPKISTSLALVQFPQKFHNLSSDDIYDSQLRSSFTIQWQGMDGLLGPVMAGTCFYIKRRALYGSSTLKELKQSFGPSNEFIKSFYLNYKHKSNEINIIRGTFLQDTQLLASCSYENHTKWGEEVGFFYSVVEDYVTCFYLHCCNGWTSVYCNPTRPHFLGSAATNLNDVLIQGTRWFTGLLGVCISRFCPLIYGPLRMSILQSMCYAELAFFPLYFLPYWCFATIPHLCLLNGIPLYPEVSNPFFIIFPFMFLASLLKHLFEVIISGGSIQTWRNEQRIWMMKSVTSYVYGSLDAIMAKFGLRNASFLPTKKVKNDEQVKLYKIGKFDF